MRYEHIELDISTEACVALAYILPALVGGDTGPEPKLSEYAKNELVLMQNELRARLQRRDIDPHCPKNFSETEEWLDT
jgi:hypothetical protein